MTKKQFRTSISHSVKTTMRNCKFFYNNITVNTKLPLYSVNAFNTSEISIFAQGEEADNFINEATLLADKTKLNVKTCLVFLLDSGGAFNN